jgi:hypothetical protein
MIIASSAPALAIPAITCHCFTEMSYDPARPFSADTYFLATTQNSFFAAAFGIEKRGIVVKKQKGVSANDLWIAYWLASRSKGDAEALLAKRNGKASWHQIATQTRVSFNLLGDRVAPLLKTNANDDRLADAVVDELLIRFRFYNGEELKGLRKAGATNQELILLHLIAVKSSQPAGSLYRRTKGGGKSWGALLLMAGIDPQQIQQEITALVAGEGSR